MSNTTSTYLVTYEAVMSRGWARSSIPKEGTFITIRDNIEVELDRLDTAGINAINREIKKHAEMREEPDTLSSSVILFIQKLET